MYNNNGNTYTPSNVMRLTMLVSQSSVSMVVRALVSASDPLDDTSEGLVAVLQEDRELKSGASTLKHSSSECEES